VAIQPHPAPGGFGQPEVDIVFQDQRVVGIIDQPDDVDPKRRFDVVWSGPHLAFVRRNMVSGHESPTR
jgi:hypothetical protein